MGLNRLGAEQADGFETPDQCLLDGLGVYLEGLRTAFSSLGEDLKQRHHSSSIPIIWPLLFWFFQGWRW